MKKSKKLKRCILNFLSILFLIIIIVSIFNIIQWLRSNRKTEIIMEELSNVVTVEKVNENKEKINVNFDQLKSTNSDTIAWLKVNGTNINYPILKSTDNDFYLFHSFDKSYNKAGWPFVDYRNKLDNTDKNIIVYGHNRRDGSMFSTLKNILNKSWYTNEENKKITFITEQGNFEYQVFSVYQVKEEDYNTTTTFDSIEKFNQCVLEAKERSIYNFNVNVKESDNIITLSTCANDNRYRVVLHAKLIK